MEAEKDFYEIKHPAAVLPLGSRGGIAGHAVGESNTMPLALRCNRYFNNA